MGGPRLGLPSLDELISPRYSGQKFPEINTHTSDFSPPYLQIKKRTFVRILLDLFWCMGYVNRIKWVNQVLISFIYRACPSGHNEYWVVDAEPNAIKPPLRGAMGPARNRRRPNWPVPIAPRGALLRLPGSFIF